MDERDNETLAALQERRARSLTDADIDAIVEKMKTTFFQNLGKGVWGFVWKAIILALIAIAMYGAHLERARV